MHKGSATARFRLDRFQSEAHTDLIEGITSLLNRAYAPLTARGFNYTAASQSPETTLARLEAGEGWLCFEQGAAHEALERGAPVGCVTLHPAGFATTTWPPYYALSHVATFEQFAVDPVYQRNGLGAWILGLVEDRARRGGATELACDTATGAHSLVRYYQARGYRIIEEIQREGKAYRSYVLSKSLAPT